MKKKKATIVPDAQPPIDPPPNPMRVMLARIQNLREEREMIVGKHREHENLIAKLEQDEKDLVATTDLDDAEQFKKISNLRLRRELLPHKIESLKRQEDEVMGELAQVCRDLSKVIGDKISSDLNQIAREISKKIGIFWDRRPADLHEKLWDLALDTNYGRAVAWMHDRLKSGFIGDRNPLFPAFELGEMVEEFEFLGIYMDPVVSKSRVLSVEDLEREELRKITADPEMFIVSKMKFFGVTHKGGNPLMPRAKAEKAVEGRREYLEKKYCSPPEPKLPMAPIADCMNGQ